MLQEFERRKGEECESVTDLTLWNMCCVVGIFVCVYVCLLVRWVEGEQEG